jgi:2-iminoacetate synthase ThiH
VEIEKLIRDAGRIPVERDTLYNSVDAPLRLCSDTPFSSSR